MPGTILLEHPHLHSKAGSTSIIPILEIGD